MDKYGFWFLVGFLVGLLAGGVPVFCLLFSTIKGAHRQLTSAEKQVDNIRELLIDTLADKGGVE